MTDGTTRERRSAAETRAEILRVAMRLFTDKGYEATTTRDIAGALGMNQSSLYYHFSGKDEIVASLVAQRRRDLDVFVDWIDAQPRGPGRLRDAALRWLDATTPEHLHGMRLALANQTVHQRLLGDEVDVRTAFGRVIARFVEPGAPAAERTYVRMVFDTASAALLASHGTGAEPADVLDAARRAVIALTAPAVG